MLETSYRLHDSFFMIRTSVNDMIERHNAESLYSQRLRLTREYRGLGDDHGAIYDLYGPSQRLVFSDLLRTRFSGMEQKERAS